MPHNLLEKLNDPNQSDSLDQWNEVACVDAAHKRTVRSVAFSPDGKYIASASFDSTTSVWQSDSETGGTNDYPKD
jgi:WD40 repeat protein